MGAILLDSHALIWLLYRPSRLSQRAIERLRTAETVYVSTVSLWELAIKHNNGKLAYTPAQLQQGVEQLNAQLLPLTAAHVSAVLSVKLPHRDPFDAMLVAQSQVEDAMFLTADNVILQSDYHAMDITK